MSKITEICEMALIIKNESGLELEASAAVAERLYEEGCRMNPIITQPVGVPMTKRGIWEPLGNLFYKCTSCGCFSKDALPYCSYCGSKNSCT